MKWDEIKATIASKDIESTPHTSFLIWHLNNAIAEIEQLRQDKARQSILMHDLLEDISKLRQDKAELVNVLKDLIRIRDHFISKRDFDLLESLPDTWEQAKELLVKHGGIQ